MSAPGLPPRIADDGVRFRFNIEEPRIDQSIVSKILDGEIYCNKCGKTWPILGGENMTEVFEKNIGYATGFLTGHREVCS